MKKKYIKTQKISFWHKLGRAVFIIPVLYILYYIITKVTDKTMFEGSIYMIIVLIALAAIVTLPIIVIWRAISTQLKRTNIQHTTFHAVADIDYYRDKLTGISPLEISLLTDLELEPQKDISALLLQYQLMGIVEIEDDTIVVVNADHPSLLASDKLLLSEIAKGNNLLWNSYEVTENWKRLAFNEASRNKWFTEPKVSTKPTAKGCLGGILFIVGPLLTLLAVEFWEPVKYFYDFVEAAPDTPGNIYLARAMAEDPALLKGFLIGIPIILFGFACVFIPIIGLISAFIYAKTSPKIARTADGNEITEYIYGLKNFIHDFSELSMAEKEQLVLWDDFLIYAVLLEENQQIIKEMLHLRSLDTSSYFVGK